MEYNSFITNIQSPVDLEELKEFQQMGIGSNLDILLNDYQNGTEWSVPSDAEVGDTVFFMCAKTSVDSRHMAGVRKQAMQRGDPALIRIVEKQYSLHKRYAGKILAAGIVTDDPYEELSAGGHSSWFAEINQISLLANPVDISEFNSFIMVSRTGAITKLSDSQHASLVELIDSRNPGFRKALEQNGRDIDVNLSPIPCFREYLPILFANDKLWEQFQYYVRCEVPDRDEDFFAYHRNKVCMDIWYQMLENMGGGWPLRFFAAASFLLLTYRDQGHDLDAELAVARESILADGFLFFWHEYEENGYLSQWYHAPFTLEGVTYQTCEQYMMAKKALLFGDFEKYSQIMKERDPKKDKALGKTVANFDHDLWQSCNEEIVYHANLAKFSQNPDLREALLATGDKILVEASPSDKIYGIGLEASDPVARDPQKWKGSNLLGTTLCRVRDDLTR